MKGRRIELRYIAGDGWESRIVQEWPDVGGGEYPGDGPGLTPWRSICDATAIEQAARAVTVGMSIRYSRGAVVSIAEGQVVELERLAAEIAASAKAQAAG